MDMDLFLAPIYFCQAHTALTIYDIEAIHSILGDNFQIDPEQRVALTFGSTTLSTCQLSELPVACAGVIN